MLHHDQLGRDKTIRHAKAEQTAASGDGCSHPPTLAQRVWELPAARGHWLPALQAGGGGSDDSERTPRPSPGPPPRHTQPHGAFFSPPSALHTERFIFPSMPLLMVSSWKPFPSQESVPAARTQHPPCKLLRDPPVSQHVMQTNHYTELC